MYYLITPRRRLGVALTPKELRSAEPVRGDIHMSELHNEILGRTTISAWLFKASPHMDDLLPNLLDAQVTGMGHQGMNITGVEQIGDVLYSQSWWCRLE